MKGLISIILILLVLGCSNSGDSDSEQELYPEAVFELSTFSIASLQESSSSFLSLPPKLNSWLITTIGSTRTQIALKLHTKNPSVSFNDPSVWALFIRTDPNPIGVKNFDEVAVNLFFNHSENDEICCVNNRPFEDFDIAEESYIPISGFVDFISERQGMFMLTFRRETAAYSGITTGQTIEISGCWFIASEPGISGCTI